MTIINRVWRWSYGLKNIAFKNRKVSDFLRGGSRLFDSIMVDGKKEFLKKMCFVLTMGMLCIFRAEYNERLVGIKLNRYLGFSFSKIL